MDGRGGGCETGHPEELERMMTECLKRSDMNNPIAGKYKHYKGQEYQVIGCARHSETLEEMVVYQPLYGEKGLWVRPVEMFMETVVQDGIEVPRFQFVPG